MIYNRKKEEIYSNDETTIQDQDGNIYNIEKSFILNTRYETKKNLKNLDNNEKFINWNISIPIIPDPRQVILYGNGEKPPIIIKIIPTS